MGSCQSTSEVKSVPLPLSSSSTTTTTNENRNTNAHAKAHASPFTNASNASNTSTDKTATSRNDGTDGPGSKICTDVDAKNGFENNGHGDGEYLLENSNEEIDIAASHLNSTAAISKSKETVSASSSAPASASVPAHDDKSEISSIGSTATSEGRSRCQRRSSVNTNGQHRGSKISLGNSSSVIGLDSMIESRREEEGLTANVVHMEVPFGKAIEEVYDEVHTGPILGSGISGVVRLVTHKATGVKYAVKCLDLGLVDTEEGLIQLREEIFIMCQLDHPNIVRLEEVYESHSEIYLVQELCLGGELFDRLDEQPDYHYTEAECARLIKQMLCAVRYLHSKGIIHRDLKLENFLFSSSSQDSELKMIDFGLSKHFRYGEVLHEAVGTPYTVAPEVIRGRYDERCDIWAIGVISFLLLSGDPPFGGCGGSEPLMTVRKNILDGSFEFEPAEIWDLVSTNAKQFINALLVTDPKLRPTATEAQKLSWLKEWAHRTKTDSDQILNANVVRALVNFKEYSDMRKLLSEVLSFTLLPDQIKDLRKEFETLDIDGSGEISLLSLKQVLVTNAGAGSLGALTEDEVVGIFQALRVNKEKATIRWHEFIAAGLSQCEVDDRNLRLAFDRLDNDHKGYVTLDDIKDLMGSDAVQSEEALQKMWGESMRDCNCNSARITYEDFVLIMKGQTRDFEADAPLGKTITHSDSAPQRLNGVLSHVVNQIDEAEMKMKELKLGDATPKERNSKTASSSNLPPSSVTSTVSNNEIEASPLSMDNNDDIVPSFTPTTSPNDKMTTKTIRSPCSESKINTLKGAADIKRGNYTSAHDLPKPSAIHLRVKSRSLDETKMKKSLDPCFPLDSRRAVAFPEFDSETKNSLTNDNGLSVLQANRQLYRSNRQMRLSVIDACKRFEEQQARHAHDVLLAIEKEKHKAIVSSAGLVMRRVENKTVVSSEAVKAFMGKHRAEQQNLMEKANRRSRGRHRGGRRKKTVSDLSAMMGSLSSEDMTSISVQASKPIKIESSYNKSAPIPPVIETKQLNNFEKLDDNTNIRSATVPGEFRSVNDPFSSHGKYVAMI